MTSPAHVHAWVWGALALLIGCQTKHEIIPPPSLDATVPTAAAGSVSGQALEARRLGDAPVLVLRLALDLPIAPPALSLTLRCRAGRRVYLDVGELTLPQPAPTTMTYLVYGGAPFAWLPERCAVDVLAMPPPGSGARARAVGAFCAAPGKLIPGPCGVPKTGKAPPNAAPIVLDEPTFAQGTLTFSVTRWSGPEVPKIELSTRCAGQAKAQIVDGLGPQPTGTSRRVRIPLTAGACTFEIVAGDARLSGCVDGVKTTPCSTENR